VLEGVEGQQLALEGAGAEQEGTLVEVVADHHRVMPRRRPRQPQVEQHHHRLAGGGLAQQGVEAAGDLDGQRAVAAGAGEHLDL
jgi:hypothetical protein